MSTGAFIQDSETRLSVMTGQPLGVASLESSSIQIFLDRHLDQDDHRGLGQKIGSTKLILGR